MVVIRAAKNWYRLLRQHDKIAVSGFVLGASALIAIGTLWPKQYTGSALIALNAPATFDSRPGGESQAGSMTALLKQVSSKQNWAGIAARFNLYPNLVEASGQSKAAQQLASQVSMELVAAPDLGGGEAVRLSYTGSDSHLVAGVTGAIVEGYTESAAIDPPKPREPAAADDGPLYAPVVLPSSAPDQGAHSSAKFARSTSKSRRWERNQWHRRAKPSTAQSAPSAALLRELRGSLVTGARIRLALDQNSATLRALSRAPSAGRATTDDPAPIAIQIARAETAQTNLQQALERNQQKVAQLEAALGGDSAPNRQASSPTELENSSEPALQSSPTQFSGQTPDAEVKTRTNPVTDTKAQTLPSTAPFFVVRPTTVETLPFFFARKFLWPLSLVFGVLAALVAAWISERHDPSIRNEGMLLRELPASAVYLGGVPRIRHEVVAD